MSKPTWYALQVASSSALIWGITLANIGYWRDNSTQVFCGMVWVLVATYLSQIREDQRS